MSSHQRHLYGIIQTAFKNASYVRPKSWHLDIWDLDPDNQENNGLQNEDLVILPTQ